jgi:four helix bundle protein
MRKGSGKVGERALRCPVAFLAWRVWGVSDFEKLEVFQKAHSLALRSHNFASGLRGADYLSLRSQLIRAAISVPANIVEGREQTSDKAFIRYLRQALASASELQYHVKIAHDLNAGDPDEGAGIREDVIEVKKMLHGLIKSLR